ncbi:unnamed protein product [Prorocentrum cordatum]|uniref:Calmodulin n=1 Tax=Prorocentrum cordatum TaxID=2364126 RepID=A0ABN9QB82_9DINO|nr:unnamed protein product [Polarella glacialis]
MDLAPPADLECPLTARSGKTFEQIVAEFRQHDPDGQGTMERGQLLHFLRQVLAPACAEHEIELVLRASGAPEAGRVAYEQFFRWLSCCAAARISPRGDARRRPRRRALRAAAGCGAGRLGGGLHAAAVRGRRPRRRRLLGRLHGGG